MLNTLRLTQLLEKSAAGCRSKNNKKKKKGRYNKKASVATIRQAVSDNPRLTGAASGALAGLLLGRLTTGGWGGGLAGALGGGAAGYLGGRYLQNRWADKPQAAQQQQLPAGEGVRTYDGPSALGAQEQVVADTTLAPGDGVRLERSGDEPQSATGY